MSNTPDPTTPLASVPDPPAPPPRRWDWRPQARWFAAEIVVVVAGVLIALALNAWWSDRQRDADEAALRAEIRRDVGATREVIAEELDGHRDLAAQARAVLTAMAEAPPGPERDSVLARVGSVFLLGGWLPVNDTYEEALSSGRLALLTDSDLRLALSRYRSAIDDIGGMYDYIGTQYYEELEPFMVANTVYSEVAYDQRRPDLVEAPFATDFDALAESRELWNLLTLRLEWEVALQEYLPRLDALAVDALDHLDS